MPFNGLNDHSVVVLEDASIHHVASIENVINSVGALVNFLPAYSPDLMPLEEVFAEVKRKLSDNHVLFENTEPRVLIAHAFSTVSLQNCLSYIQHAGYI